jgi:hypothetical protein
MSACASSTAYVHVETKRWTARSRLAHREIVDGGDVAAPCRVQELDFGGGASAA